MKLNEIQAPKSAIKKSQRSGRGDGSGRGNYSGRGMKGQMSRSGSGRRWGFEGGQTPLFRRIPKRGFNNKRFATNYVELPVTYLNRFEDGAVVNLSTVKESGIIKFNHDNDGLKIIGNDELTVKLTVQAAKFTKSAKEVIEAAGGVAEEV